jgi:hypothetical protein
MDTAPQPTDEDLALDALLERARVFILDLMIFLEGIFDRLGSVPLSTRLAHRLTRDALIPAETALRRAILILAASLPVPVIAVRAAKGPAKPRAAAPKPAHSRPPRFSMNEPAPRDRTHAADHSDTDYMAEDQLPRILALTDAILFAPPAPPPKPAPARPDAATIFCRRFAALQAAYQDANGEAERWARRRVRAASRPGANPRPLPVPLPRPRLAKSVPRDSVSLLGDLTEAANTSFGHNTS